MHYKDILQYLYSLETPKIKLGLERVQALLDKIGNPEKNLKYIHVAGTNGKGSVCAMLLYILKEAGYKVGLYTSPHLKRFNERIRINDKFISDNEIAGYFLKVKPHITNQSFFEITTAMAFLYFYDKKVDFAVLEAGLGGRLDATNVVNPLASVITNIGLEHTNLLGNSIEKIAFEKAGIIKNNVPVVTGAKGKALKVIEKIAGERNAPLFLAKEHPDSGFMHLTGQYQQQNKDIALAAVSILKKLNQIKINENKIKSGLKRTQWNGRMQFISKNVLVDCAHNPDGFEVLKKELEIIKNKKNIRKFVFIIGIQSDKDAPAMLKRINSLVSAIIFTKSKNKKAENPKQLLKIFNKINQNKPVKTKIIQNPRSAMGYARKISDKNDLVVVAGSIYLAGEMI
jgi:dihydrofolate synthase/folylpolyglutamate synthase